MSNRSRRGRKRRHLPRPNRDLEEPEDHAIEDFEENKKALPHVAPEILLNRSGDTYATEIFAIGYIFEEVGIAFGIPRLVTLAERCLEFEPDERPSLMDVHWTLNDIKIAEVYYLYHNLFIVQDSAARDCQ